MDNVINMFSTEEPSSDESINEFIKYFMDWAEAHGVDTSTIDFKYDAALIMTVLQSLIHQKETE